MDSSASRVQSRLERVPWLALASILIVLVCIGASISIIVTSDTQTVDSWRIQPAVLLAILASASNVALGTAFSAAVVATWWTSAIEGASLAQLHYIWDRGEGISFFSALAAGANARRVVLTATIIIMVKLATNPLLQRATHQGVDRIATREPIKLNIVQYIPEDSLGNFSGPRQPIILSKQSRKVVRDWWKNATITSLDAPGYYCDGTCEGNVPGAGMHYKCSSTTQAVDLLTFNGTVFEVNATMSPSAPFLLLTILHSSAIDKNCTATLTIDTCKIEAGIVEYPIILQNSTVTLDSNKLNNVAVLSTKDYPGDLPTTENGDFVGPLQILSVIGLHLASKIVADGPSKMLNIIIGSVMEQYFFEVNPSSYDGNTFDCPVMWTSPTNYVLNSMQNVMFRAALHAANATDVQTFTVLRTRPALVFHSVYGYLAAASALTLLVLFIILILLQSWWVLGRTTTLSPLETAKAFCVPLMEQAGYNTTIDRILGDVGQTWVQYVDEGLTVTVHDTHIEQPIQKNIRDSAAE